uniref:Uncharacterized protein n=1 Tax=Schizaphis graminum TaxID=13262 RepID=A0A2S2NK50_SCHGA
MSILNYFDFDSKRVIVQSNIVNLSEFSAIIRTTIDQKAESYSLACDKWINLFSNNSKTNWIVKSTFPNKTNYLYRKDYTCQHSSKNKKTSILTTRNRNKQCQAAIKIVIKKDTIHTRRRDEHLRNGLNTEIQIKFIHTHKLHNAEAYSFLKVSNGIHDNFVSYFNNGMTPSAAKSYHEVQLTASNEEYDEMEFIKLLANAQINPTERQVQYMYENLRTTHFGDRSNDGIVNILREKQSMFEKDGGRIDIGVRRFCSQGMQACS